MTTFLAKTALQRSGQPVSAAAHSNLTWRATATSAAANTTHTFSSQNIGTAAANRWVIVAVDSGNAATPSSVTVGGVTATFVIGAGNGPFIYAANITSGTTANIVISYAGNEPDVIMGYWTVNMPSGTASDTEVGSDFDADVSTTIDIPANGFAVGASWSFDGSDRTHSVDASFTEQAEAFSGSNNIAFFHREVVAGVTGVTVTSTWSATAGATAIALASWA